MVKYSACTRFIGRFYATFFKVTYFSFPTGAQQTIIITCHSTEPHIRLCIAMAWSFNEVITQSYEGAQIKDLISEGQ